MAQRTDLKGSRWKRQNLDQHGCRSQISRFGGRWWEDSAGLDFLMLRRVRQRPCSSGFLPKHKKSLPRERVELEAGMEHDGSDLGFVSTILNMAGESTDHSCPDHCHSSHGDYHCSPEWNKVCKKFILRDTGKEQVLKGRWSLHEHR